MSIEFKLPELGEGVHEGELVQWRVKPGDSVHEDQPLCEIMTDKATVEIPSPFRGTIQELRVKEGQTVTVGSALMTYDSSTGAKAAPAKTQAPSAPTPSPTSSASTSARSAAPISSSQSGQSGHSGHSGAMVAGEMSVDRSVFASPSTRRFARELGVNLSNISGTGPSGRVLREDVERQSRTPSTGVSSSVSIPSRTSFTPKMGVNEERVAFKGLRKKIAEKMRLSKDHAAHFTYVEEADVTELVKLRNHAKQLGTQRGIKVTYLPLIMKAMVAALRQYPALNSTLDEEKGELIYKYFYNIGLSVQTDDGLMAPVIRNVELKTIFEIAKEIQDIVELARKKQLGREHFLDGTITLTNAGTIGGLFATPIINFPEVAILGFNKIFRKPVAQQVDGNEKVVVRDWTYFSLSLDHRVVDGAIAAEFMKLFIQYIENPSLLVLES